MHKANTNKKKISSFLIAPFKAAAKIFGKEKYVKLEFHHVTKTRLNLENPTRYTEKLQYLRLNVFPKEDIYSECTDRVAVRDYLKRKGFCDKLINIYGVFNKFEDINFDSLPNSFVMKCSHASGLNYIVFNKEKTDLNKVKKLFNRWLKIDYGKKTIEPHYSKIKPQIIIEELLLQEFENLPVEYKIHCFNGKAKYLYVVTSRAKSIKYNNFYIDWTPFPQADFNDWEESAREINKPLHFDQMVEMSEILAKDFPFVRVDLYNINGKIYFSELTFTPARGVLKFKDPKADYEIGEWLDISKYISAK